MRIPLALIFLLIAIPCYASNQFYDPSTNKLIEDVSGRKTLDQIKKEFNLSDGTEIIALSKGYGIRVKNKKIETYNLAEEKEAKEQEKKASKDAAIQRISTKLNLSEQDINDLAEALE